MMCCFRGEASSQARLCACVRWLDLINADVRMLSAHQAPQTPPARGGRTCEKEEVLMKKLDSFLSSLAEEWDEALPLTQASRAAQRPAPLRATCLAC